MVALIFETIQSWYQQKWTRPQQRKPKKCHIRVSIQATNIEQKPWLGLADVKPSLGTHLQWILHRSLLCHIFQPQEFKWEQFNSLDTQLKRNPVLNIAWRPESAPSGRLEVPNIIKTNCSPKLKNLCWAWVNKDPPWGGGGAMYIVTPPPQKPDTLQNRFRFHC